MHYYSNVDAVAEATKELSFAEQKQAMAGV
jgi:hypothetical protein